MRRSHTSPQVWYVAKDSEAGSSRGLSWGVSYAQGDRQEMEDTHITRTEMAQQPSLAFFAVFDGHGGNFVSDRCQELMPGLISARLPNQPAQPTVDVLSAALRDACFELDSKLYETRFRALTCGSTGIMALVTGNNYIVANVGDSRGIVIRQLVSIY